MFRNVKSIKNILPLILRTHNVRCSTTINLNQKQYSSLLYSNLNKLKCRMCYSLCHSSENQKVLLQKDKKCYLTSTPKSSFNDKYFSNKVLNNVALKYPNPKNSVNNYYVMVSHELKGHQLMTQYKIGKKHDWSCTYSVHWPQEMCVSATAPTKTEASKKAALRLLYLLDQQGKITSNGQPVIYDQQEFDWITKKSHLNLKLDNNVEEKLREISHLYENHMKEHVEKTLTDIILEKQLQHITNKTLPSSSLIEQRFRSYSSYLAKEPTPMPVQAHRQELEQLLDKTRVLIVRGEPGCGKSTRIPQYVLEHWVSREGARPCRIAVTQPRRIAAISLAERVSTERAESLGDVVGYHVRFNSKFDQHACRILYCTTGILLRQVQADPTLQCYTHVVLDEAHERSVNIDLLLSLLRRALLINTELRLLVMSATMDANLFSRYLGNAPVLEIPGSLYPVQQYFLEDLPLKLKRTRDARHDVVPSFAPEDISELVRWIHEKQPPGAILCFLPGWEEIARVLWHLQSSNISDTCMLLTLHSNLSDQDQKKIFYQTPPGIRKIILATNIAETSITINDVVYVVDSGTHREPRFDADRGLDCTDTYWISQSSVRQRAGRAGRVRPGFSYHLYPKSVYESMAKYAVPEMQRVSLTKVVLDSKVYNSGSSTEDFFDELLSPPKKTTVTRAVHDLSQLDLLDDEENVTPLGCLLAEFQISPALAKVMLHAVMYKCVTPIVDIATVFGTDNTIFSKMLQDKQEINHIKKQFCLSSDHVAVMRLLQEAFDIYDRQDQQSIRHFCQQYNIVFNKIRTLIKLEDIHFGYLKKQLKGEVDFSDKFSTNEEIIKGVLLLGVNNLLMYRNWDIIKGRLKTSDSYITQYGEKATITADSLNSKGGDIRNPFYVYINQVRSVVRKTNLIRETSLVNPLTVLLFKNGEILMKKINENNNTENLVLLQFKNTKIKILCSERQAELIVRTNKILRTMEKYFITDFMSNQPGTQEINTNWEEILHILNTILQSSSDET